MCPISHKRYQHWIVVCYKTQKVPLNLEITESSLYERLLSKPRQYDPSVQHLLRIAMTLSFPSSELQLNSRRDVRLSDIVVRCSIVGSGDRREFYLALALCVRIDSVLFLLAFIGATIVAISRGSCETEKDYIPIAFAFLDHPECCDEVKVPTVYLWIWRRDSLLSNGSTFASPIGKSWHKFAWDVGGSRFSQD